MKPYNQNLDKYSSMWCSVYTLFHVIFLKFHISVVNNFLLKLLAYFEKILVRNNITWASFEKIRTTFEKEVNKKLWIKIKVITKKITDITKDDTWTYWIWMLKYHSWLKLIDDWKFDKDDVDKFLEFDWKTYQHALAWDWSKWWYLINSNWSDPLSCPLDTLLYMVSKWLLWNTARTIEPNDYKTKIILSMTMTLWKAADQWKLNEYLITNKDNIYLPKVKELYFYGR